MLRSDNQQCPTTPFVLIVNQRAIGTPVFGVIGIQSGPRSLEAEAGMLIVETIAKVRRVYFVQGKSIKAICRELGLSRKVVRKMIRLSALARKSS